MTASSPLSDPWPSLFFLLPFFSGLRLRLDFLNLCDFRGSSCGSLGSASGELFHHQLHLPGQLLWEPTGGRGLTGPSRTVSATQRATQQLPPTLLFPRPIPLRRPRTGSGQPRRSQALPMCVAWARRTPLELWCLCPSCPVQPRWGQLPADGVRRCRG